MFHTHTCRSVILHLSFQPGYVSDFSDSELEKPRPRGATLYKQGCYFSTPTDTGEANKDSNTTYAGSDFVSSEL